MVDTYESATIALKCVRTGENSYNFYETSESDADVINNHLGRFWSKLPGFGDEKVKEHVLEYRTSFMGTGFESLHSKLFNLYENRDPEGPFSMIDLGGANGSIFYALKDRFDVDSIRYLLIEPFEPCVDDFLDNFPSQTAIVGDAQAFIGMTDDVFSDAPYTVFFASLVFCMIKPDIVRKTLKRAAALADNIVIFDMVENLNGDIDGKNPIVFDYNPGGQQWYFAHLFSDYLSENGFEIVSVDRTKYHQLTKEGGDGWAFVHATRQAPNSMMKTNSGVRR